MTKKTFGRPSADIDLNLDDGLDWVSPITGKTYTFKLVSIKGDQIQTAATISPYNSRSQDQLSLADVSDIYPSIELDKTNTHPIRAVGSKSNFCILEGSRRSFCVSKVENATLMVLLTPKMDEEDQRHIATISDIYRNPTTIDIALQIKKHELMDVSLGKIAKTLKISKTSAFNAKKIVSIPEEIYSLFPGVSYIKIRFLISLKGKEEELKSILPSCSPYTSYLTEDELELHNAGVLLDEDVYSKATAKVENEITEHFKKPKAAVNLPKSYIALSQVEGLKVSVNASGAVNLTLSKELAEDKAEQIKQILLQE